jgi:hypothetical protein
MLLKVLSAILLSNLMIPELSLSQTAAAPVPDIAIKHPQTTTGVTMQTMTPDKLSSLKVSVVEVIDPNESTAQKPAKISFKAYDGLKFLDLAFGSRSAWANSKNLVFECADGYRPSLETSEFVKGGFHIAIDRVGTKEFTIINNHKDGKKAQLAPWYFVWTDAAKQSQTAAHLWPYQVVNISTEK